MINPVSFRADTANNSFDEIINKPQKFTKDPAATSQIGEDTYEGKKEKKHTGLKLLGLTALTAGLLAIGHGTGITSKIPKAGKYLDFVGSKIWNGAAAVEGFVIEKIDVLKEKFGSLKERVSDYADDFDFGDFADDLADDFEEFAEEGAEILS